MEKLDGEMWVEDYLHTSVCVCAGVDEGQTQLVKVKVFSIVESLR